MRTTVAAVALLVMSLLPSGLAGHYDEDYEADEADRALLEAIGQNNCVAEASRQRGGVRCDSTADGIVMLDSMAYSSGPGAAGAGHPIGQDRALAPFYLDSNQHRETGGAVNDVILPGDNDFHAWYGPWDDRNVDGVLDIRIVLRPATSQAQAFTFGGYAPDTEFRALNGAADRMYAWVTPGSHPPSGTDPTRPDDAQPDFQYSFQDQSLDQVWSMFTGSVYLDGSLLEDYRVDTVTNPILLGDPVALRPYRLSPTSLVDIDRYAAVVSTPLSPIYSAMVSPFVQLVNSPGVGLCPNNCQFPPLPVAVPLGLANTVWGPYEHETDPGTANSASGFASMYKTDYHGWVDVVPGFTHGTFAFNGNHKVYPLPAFGEDGGLAMPPGLFNAELWTGIWKDLNEDGYIGTATSDPHDGGNRPVADQYYAPRGEFVAWNPVRPAGSTVRLSAIFTPDSDWGPQGIFLFGTTPTPTISSRDCPGTVIGPPPSPVTTTPSGLCHVTGAQSFEVPFTTITTPGHFPLGQYPFFPSGSAFGGFTVCLTPGWTMSFDTGSSSIDEPLADCDHVERLTV